MTSDYHRHRISVDWNYRLFDRHGYHIDYKHSTSQLAVIFHSIVGQLKPLL